MPKSIKDGIQVLKHDVEVISFYLDELTEVEDPPPMAKCWMNEAHDLSYDMEDYIDSLLFVPPYRFIKKKKKRRRRKTKKMMLKKRLKWYKQIVFRAQVSEYGIKTSKINHVNVSRLPSVRAFSAGYGTGTKVWALKAPPLVPVRHDPALKCHHVA